MDTFSGYDSLEDEAETSDLVLRNGTVLEYIGSGNKTTPNSVDGYLIQFQRGQNQSSTFAVLSERNVAALNFVQMNIQYIHYNRNTGIILF